MEIRILVLVWKLYFPPSVISCGNASTLAVSSIPRPYLLQDILTNRAPSTEACFASSTCPPQTPPPRQYHQHNKIQSTFFMLIKLSVHGRSIYIRIFPWCFSLLVRPRRRVSSRCPRRDAPLMDWYKSSVFPLKGSRSVQNVLKNLSESCLKPFSKKEVFFLAVKIESSHVLFHPLKETVKNMANLNIKLCLIQLFLLIVENIKW